MTVLLALWLAAAPSAAEPPVWWGRMLASIESHLGRPYAWGSTGLKGFDCSGFVWRVLAESGMLTKRTTARKYYLSLKPATRAETKEAGSIVFFDNLKHVGIVSDGATFYHAAVSTGTSKAAYQPYWGKLVCGYRRSPLKTN
jgi:cell wall-associated NlpC family hydrolase